MGGGAINGFDALHLVVFCAVRGGGALVPPERLAPQALHSTFVWTLHTSRWLAWGVPKRAAPQTPVLKMNASGALRLRCLRAMASAAGV